MFFKSFFFLHFRRIESPSGNSIVLTPEGGRIPKEPNGRSLSQRNDRQIDRLYETPESFKHNVNVDNHVDNSFREVPNIEGSVYRHKGPRDRGSDSGALTRELSDMEKKRSQFRRSPSYTNAISIDNDTDGESTPISQNPGISVPQQNCNTEISPKRCPSYSDAVEQSPVLNGKGDHLEPKSQHTRTKYFDGKYYVGVANETDDNAL